MKPTRAILNLAALAALLIGATTGCESTGGGSSASSATYYGTGWYDPWYYDGHYDHGDIIVTPPPSRPVSPEQPIYRPPTPRPTPMPSIPSTPRPAPRR